MGIGGLSTHRLGRVRGVLSGYVERGEVPGLVTLVSRKGETHVEALGAMAFGSAPMRRDTIFRIASMTKPVAAVAAMILVEECRLRLDDPVDRLLPELADRKVLNRLDGPLDDTVPARRPIAVRDLLAFTMGFGQLMASPDAYPILKAAWENHIGMGLARPRQDGFRQGVHHAGRARSLGVLAEFNRLPRERGRVGPVFRRPVPDSRGPHEDRAPAGHVRTGRIRHLLHVIVFEGIHLAHAGPNEVGVDGPGLQEEIQHVALAIGIETPVLVPSREHRGDGTTDK